MKIRVVLVERLSPGEQSRLGELEELAQTLDFEVVSAMQQVRHPDPTYQIGRGKAKELANLVKDKKAQRVVFSNQLTPTQAYKLARLVGVEVVDKFQIVLEIFAMRAGSPEAKLQIEYAKLKYEMPKIREQIKNLLNVEQPGFRGGGEYEVNVRYDMVKRKLADLRRKLKAVEKNREERRKFRRKRGFKLVALAGYTNSGKSTLLNVLTGAKAEVDDMYFTTLMPRTRALKASQMTLMTDTVGFIDDLPPSLVEAFKATLEEIYLADLVIMLVDASDPIPEIIRKLRASLKVLSEYPVRVVTALNKVDLVAKEDLKRKMEVLHSMTGTVVPISATRGINLGALLDVVRGNA